MLRAIDENLWGVEHDLFMPAAIHFRTRMTVAGLPDGGLQPCFVMAPGGVARWP